DHRAGHPRAPGGGLRRARGGHPGRPVPGARGGGSVMSIVSTLGLGLRLAVGRGRHGLMRLALMTAGVGIGVALVVGGLGIAPALDARRAREFARIPAVFAGAEAGPDTGATPYSLLWARSVDQIAGQEVVGYR